MKKVIRCLGMMALMALAFTSCKKTEEQSTFKATVPGLTIADVQDDEDRAYIQINGTAAQPVFEKNDRAMIFNISVTNPEASHCASYKTLATGTSVDFINAGTGTVGVALDGGYYAYYPSFIVLDDSDPENPDYVLDRLETELEGIIGETPETSEAPANKSKFYVSPVQEYREGKVARHDLYMAAHLTQEEAPNLADAAFVFTPVCGVLQLQAYETAQRTVTKIEIIDNTMALSGWVECIIPAIHKDELRALFNHLKTDPTNPTYLAQLNQFRADAAVNITETGHSVTLDIPGGVQLGPNKNNPAIFNIALRPLALMNGFHIILTFDDGSTKDCDLTSKNWLVSPNELQRRLFNVDKY
jgi:hypothetical protein